MSTNIPPDLALLRMITGFWVSQALYVVAKLEVADHLEATPRTPAELAQLTGARPDTLHRVLRMLAGVGVFAEDGDGRFALTPLADHLRARYPTSLRAFAIMMGEPWHWRAWGELLHSVRTGDPAFEHAFGRPLFDYYAEHPEAGAASAAGLTCRSGPENAAVVAAYAFPNVTIVDVGGGQGTLLAAVLASAPGARGILFEMPHVLAAARRTMAAAGLADRCEMVGGDFFASVPEGGDLYLLKKVIHDWDDDRATAILANCRAAMRAGGRVLLIENIVPPGNEPSFAKLLDLEMLVLTSGGRERTEPEFEALLAAAGLRLHRILPTAVGVSIIEAMAG